MTDNSEDLIKAFTNIDNYSEMEQLFKEIFTKKEKKDLSLRWLLMKELTSGMSQREIALKNGISLCKITRGAKILKAANSVCLKILSERRK